MVHCQECGTENVDDSQFCFNCGAKITKNSPNENVKSPQINKNQRFETFKDTGKSSKWDDFILTLDFSAIGKGLVIGLIIGIFTAGFIGIFFGGMIAGYYTNNKRLRYAVINGWIVGFVNVIIFAIISFLIPSSALIQSFTDAEGIIGSTSLTIILALIIWLVLWALFALIGSIGGIIGSKISKRNKS